MNPARRKWISDLGRTMISRILVQAEVDPEPFQRAWDELTNFLEGHARRGTCWCGGWVPPSPSRIPRPTLFSSSQRLLFSNTRNCRRRQSDS